MKTLFIDTNVLVNAMAEDAPDHSIARSRLARANENFEPLRISRQILREYLAVVTRAQHGGETASRIAALNDVSRFASEFEILEDGPSVTATLIALCREIPTGGSQIHDANIVATMLAHGENRLMTFNVADFRRFSNLIEIVSE